MADKPASSQQPQPESWDDVPVRDCYTKVQGERCGPRHGWGSWLNTLYVCTGTDREPTDGLA